MAEGWTHYLKGDQIEVYSAGIETHELDPLAVKAMNESGVDISTHKSKNVSSLMHIRFDYVITVCDHAYENCPIFPGHAKVIHAGFDDPPMLAKNAGTDEEAMIHYRRIRDEIHEFVENLSGKLLEAKE